MKKIILLVLSILFLNINSAFAAEGYFTSAKEIAKIQNQVSTVGYKLLNANGIEKRVVFYYKNDSTVNAFTYYSDRKVVICRGLYIMLDDEAQLAAVLGHEISHGMDSYNGIFRGTFSYWNNFFTPKKYEYKADKRAVDYMVNAGYNPVAMIVMMNKSFGQRRYDWRSTHPLTSRRMMEVYEYIYKKYPEYLVNNPYKTNIYYQNFLLTSKENRAKFQEKVKTNSTKKVNYL